MPELPEVETVRTGLEMALKGAVIQKVTLKRDNLRIPFPENFCKALAGKSIFSIKRRAKYLLFYLDKDPILIAHLGMTGRFSISATSAGIHDHVIFHLKDGRNLIYNDARRFGLMTLTSHTELTMHPLLSELGPEPLDKDFSPAYLKNELGKRNIPVKVAIMDQKLVVGVGNIYASESLFLACIDPRKPAKSVASQSRLIINCIQKVLKEAIDSGGSSLRDFIQVSGETGYFQHHFNVYGRAGKPCLTCHTTVRNIRLAGRSTFYCPECQK